jgi:hypothetical protein
MSSRQLCAALAVVALAAWPGAESRAQDTSTLPPRPSQVVPIPDSSGFSVIVPYRGGYVNVPVSPSGQPMVPGYGAPGVAAPPVPPAPPEAPVPPAPPMPSMAPRSDFGYEVISPRTTSPQPPPGDSGFFVVPRP